MDPYLIQLLANTADPMMFIGIGGSVVGAVMTFAMAIAKTEYSKGQEKYERCINAMKFNFRLLAVSLVLGTTGYAIPDYEAPQPAPVEMTTREGKYQQLFTSCMRSNGSDDKLTGIEAIELGTKLRAQATPVCHAQALQVVGER